MTASKYIVDIIEDVVDTMSLTCYYLYGHPVEVVNTLSEWSKHPAKKVEKFPLIILMQDFEERKGTAQGINSEVSLNIVIATNTLNSYKSVDRYTNTFKAILYPLYDEFIDRVKLSGYFKDELLQHVKIDRVYWGKSGLYGNTGNTFNDYIDAIEIQNLELKILNNFKNC
jgi:hypothetical protein